MSLVAPSIPPSGQAGRLRVMVVDDSTVMRAMLARVVGEDPAAMEVVAQAVNGHAAVERARKGDIDVIVLDIEMPVMDGLTALPLLLAIVPRPVVIMASTLTTRNADISLKAMAAGAKDYVPKPSSVTPGSGLHDFKRELLEKIRVLGNRYRRIFRPQLDPAQKAGLPALKLRAPSTARPVAIAIGSSTGGPNALMQVLKAIPAPAPVPIFITQHMPPTFTRMLAENLQRETGHVCAEAIEGEAVSPGRVYVAPGDYHMCVELAARRPVIRLNQNERENFCRPAVDPMLRSLAPIYARGLLVTILTGMGQDGLTGCESVVANGGTVVAQDEESSVVWGMPGAVAKAGVCASVVPLQKIGPEITRLVTR